MATLSSLSNLDIVTDVMLTCMMWKKKFHYILSLSSCIAHFAYSILPFISQMRTDESQRRNWWWMLDTWENLIWCVKKYNLLLNMTDGRIEISFLSCDWQLPMGFLDGSIYLGIRVSNDHLTGNRSLWVNSLVSMTI